MGYFQGCAFPTVTHRKTKLDAKGKGRHKHPSRSQLDKEENGSN